jgi:hypothetical protein
MRRPIMSDVAFFLPASPFTGRGADGGIAAGGGGSIGGCGGLSLSGGGCCAAVIGIAEHCLWRDRGVAERQRCAIQFLIPEISSGRGP